MIPQLRIKSEFSFRNAWGSIDRIAEVLKALQTPSAGLVDTSGTWGHVDWEKVLSKTDTAPMFGTEFKIENEDGRKPACWVLAEDLAQFYRLSSSNPTTPEEMAAARGVIRFAGASLTDPDTFDYIDINPRSRRQTLKALELALHTSKPIVVTGDNNYPAPDDRLRYLAWDDSKKMTPQHILSEVELRKAFWYVDEGILTQGFKNNFEVAERAQGLRLNVAPIISVKGDLEALVEEGRQYRLERGHIEEWTPEYAARLKREMELIELKDYKSYFIVVAELMLWSKERMLCGPARGSSAGSLVCFLLQITEVDPLPHHLIFERFIDVNRSDLPDIDVDLSDKSRYLAFEHLADKYGKDNTARIGSINRLKPRSAVAHAGKKLGIPHGAAFPVLNVLLEYSSGDSRYGKALEDTLTTTQPGQVFAEKYPECHYMADIENTASHTGQHAAGQIVANVPVVEYCTVRDGIAHVDKHGADYLNLLKIDVLGLRTLGIIEDADVMTAQELYDLTMDDPKVFEIFNDRKFSGVFQFEGAGQRRVSEQIQVDHFDKIDHITALARPGPLASGGTNSYINRLRGTEAVEYAHPLLEQYLGDTQGIVIYQEQTMRISREIGKLPWEDVSDIRKAMSGSKGEEYFNKHGANFTKGALSLGLDKDAAATIWNSIVTFGSWGMNKSHTVSYSIISYWCAYLKTYYPLEFAAATLRHAKDDQQVIEILRELNEEGVPYMPFDPDKSAAQWSVADGKLLGGYTNLVGIGPVKSAYYVNKRESEEGLTEADYEKIAKHKMKYDDLRPAHSLWGHLYDDPDGNMVAGPIQEFGDLEDKEHAVIICQLVRLERRDENETVRVARRGSRWRGPSLFLDTFVVDDSVSSPIRARVNIKHWERMGEPFADRAVPGDWFLMRGRFLAQFSMFTIYKVRCLTNPEMFT